MNRSRFAYFLNAIHYCMWLNDIKFGDFIGRIVDVVLSPIPKLFFTKKYRKKYESRLPQAQKIKKEFSMIERQATISVGQIIGLDIFIQDIPWFCHLSCRVLFSAIGEWLIRL